MERDIKIDILKVVGLLCIILAHVDPPSIIFQLRNFDVVLMILISSRLGIINYKKIKFFTYIKKRFIRLVVPTWLFLTLFFIICVLFDIIDIDYKTLLTSFGLYSGIGYVWIIRIYLITAMLIPLYKLFVKKNLFYIIMIIIVYLIYEVLCHYGFFNNIIFDYLFSYIIPCFLLINVSAIIFNSSKNIRLLIFIISFVTFLLIGLYLYKATGRIQPTQIMKYPFRLYYLAYGIFVSEILIGIVSIKKVNDFLNKKIIIFMSKHSLWIYLWHIFILYVIKPLNLVWYIKYIFVMLLSLLITILQSTIVKKCENIVDKNILNILNG